MTRSNIRAEEVREPLIARFEPSFRRLPVYSACALSEGVGRGDDAKVKAYNQTQRKFLFALVLALFFMFIEVAGGIYAGSLAIITDAAHLLSDVSGFGVSMFAAYYAAKKSSEHHSFGYHRVEVLGALASMISVWLVTGILVWEAGARIIKPEPVDGKIMFIIAVVGILVNVALIAILGGHHHGPGHNHDHGHSHSHEDHSHAHSHDSDHAHADDHDHDHDHAHGNGLHAAEEGQACHSHGHSHGNGNINMQGAVMHVIGDLVQSIGVAIAGALIWWKQDDPRWALADPICTFIFAALVMWTTLSVMRDVADVLMERAPRGMDVPEIRRRMVEIAGVEDVHDLHVWSLTPGIPLLASHVYLDGTVEPPQVLASLNAYLRGMGIEHSTLQLVDGSSNDMCPCNVPSAGSSSQQLAGGSS